MDLQAQSFVDLRWQDIFDILLNSYILFRLYVLFRGTKVSRALIAITILWVFERLAISIGLIVTSWAIQGIIAAAALIIIIVFRNEIASVFRANTFQSLLWGIPERQIQPTIEIITESVYELARHKLGALIVLPLKKGIEDVVYGGIPWEGKLSREMLLSIFWHGTPVHDGAIVIRGDQVVEVATILPLSKKEDLPSHFGTRHRAAAGLTEQTDALVIVVSEERGEVTLFKDKTVVSIKDSIELNQLLRQYADTVSTTKEAKNLKAELAIAAMICLASVTGIWLSFARGVETLATLEVPVEFMNRDPKMQIYSASASNVKLQISGSGSLIRAVSPKQVKVKINLANTVAGNNQVAITRDGIVLPPGISLKQLEPETLEVNLDVPVIKRLSIQPDWAGKLPADLILKEVYTVPETVKVVGGALTLKDIRSIYTEKIPLDNLTTDGEISAIRVLLPSSLKLKDESQRYAKVIYDIARRDSVDNAQ